MYSLILFYFIFFKKKKKAMNLIVNSKYTSYYSQSEYKINFNDLVDEFKTW